MEDILSYYTSLTINNRLNEGQIIEKSTNEGIIPRSIRYGIMNNVFRGAIKTLTDELYYFNYRPDTDTIRLVKANDTDKIWEANRLLKSCKLGCDFVKSLEAIDDDGYEPHEDAKFDEPVKKTSGSSGGDSGGAALMPDTEENNINIQDDLITQQHPGAALGLTPDNPARGKQWHEETPYPTVKSKFWTASDLIKGLNQELKKATPREWKPVSDLERQFLTQELGRTNEQIDTGLVHMTPIQKVRFQQWANKSLKNQLNELIKWTK